ncbi:MAG: carbohydrate binding family 9 domain-containing protein [Bacteroidetes bacterium]|jgi:hypothetical protein|nr:carbohydrate binding family 9 domain-containing protein [Bacteroidota bacterium]MBT3750866.1 carbohydrate binding family 9 domain-containing protein [Bacteroidota bacterium]MBT4398644.1 carbohydrate binding family 9 domain-containing protein [Bacteroidota bacterium]MBT4409845.1 carbohydrate binding family 9 domain-containing protein [Bacteroidota bacterium]MBT7093317.1 carbohydrate binding family 9 domain-containing protein [Bacteroidota bacterium]
MWRNLIVLLLALLSLPTFSNEAIKLTKTQLAPEIDGILDDIVWQKAEKFTGFKSFIPDFGKEMPQKTESWISYDEENLYFAFRCYDDEPDKIIATIRNRDDIGKEDWVCVNLDSHNDQQAISAFYVNPFGIQADARFAAGQEDESADFVWYSAGQIDEQGYTIEIRIPLKSLRFSDHDPVEMGIILERKIARQSIQGMYPEMDPDQGYAFLNQMMVISMTGVKHYKLFEAIPALTYSNRNSRDAGAWGDAKHTSDPSLTLKYGITSDLILDATLNPDYSQVEADAGQIDVNLRYNVFYPEKRPFFLEGKEKFAVAATRTFDLDPMYLMVNTRTIVNPLTGLKFSGKVNETNDFTILYAMDELAGDQDIWQKNYQHVPVVRFKRSFSGDSYIGALYSGGEAKENFNRMYGADGQIRLNKSTLLEFNGFRSHTSGESDIEVGHAASVYLNKDTRNLQYGLIFKDLSEDFHANTAFIRRTGITQIGGRFLPKFYSDSKVFKRFDVELFGMGAYDKIYSMWEHFSFASVTAYLGGTSMLLMKYYNTSEIYLGERFKTGGFHALFATQIGDWFSGSVVNRYNNAIYYSSDPYAGLLNRFSLSLKFQPITKFNIDLSFLYYNFREADTKDMVYTYPIERLKLTYQFNKFLFVRGVLEYNGYRKNLLTDFLVSFNYIPGTVFYLGYGSLFESIDLAGERMFNPDQAYDMERGLFLKLSYLFRR